MDNINKEYESLISQGQMDDISIDQAINITGRLIDLSLDLRRIEGIKHALKLIEDLQRRQLSSEQRSLLHYFQANAWSNMRQIYSGEGKESWDWEQDEVENEIFYLRTSMMEEGFERLHKIRKCQVLTNLGNLLSNIGRCVEAIEYWDRALEIDPNFGLAFGNRGLGLFHYGVRLYDSGHRSLFLKFAYSDLIRSLQLDIQEDAKKVFDMRRREIEAGLKYEFLVEDYDMQRFSLGDGQEEISYRKWCLSNRLFLNPLNDLGPNPIAAQDILSTPNIVTGVYEGPYYQGFFNQIKQEYVSTRYLFYEGITSKSPHFSDRWVILYNTLDYPAYSLAVEKMKMAYRVAYSIFDKVSYFINKYLQLSIPPQKVSYQTLWYTAQKRKNGLRADLQNRENLPLRGLFWISKDLFEDKPGFRDVMEPSAQKINEIRNHLEHKYLKIHDDLWAGSPKEDDPFGTAMADSLSYSVYRKDFQEKTLKLLKMVRTAIIHLALAIHVEESQRLKKRSPNTIIAPMIIGTIEDDWKV